MHFVRRAEKKEKTNPEKKKEEQKNFLMPGPLTRSCRAIERGHGAPKGKAAVLLSNRPSKKNSGWGPNLFRRLERGRRSLWKKEAVVKKTVAGGKSFSFRR